MNFESLTCAIDVSSQSDAKGRLRLCIPGALQTQQHKSEMRFLVPRIACETWNVPSPRIDDH